MSKKTSDKKDKYKKMRKKRRVKERKKPGEGEFKGTAMKKKPETEKEKREKWNRVASQDWTFLKRPAREKIAQRINHELGGKKDKKTIELAAGEIQHVKGSQAIDFSKEMLKKNPSKERMEMNLDKLAEGEKLPYKKKSVDGAMMIYGINYMKDKKSIIDEISRVMKDNGKIFFFGSKKSGLRGYPRYGYEPEKLKKMLKKEGFNIHEEKIGAEGKPFGRLIEAGKKLDPERAENRKKLFEKQWKKRLEKKKERREKQERIKEKNPEQYQSTTDYWRTKVAIDKIEKKLQEKGIKAEIKPRNTWSNEVQTKRENQAAPSPADIKFSVVTNKEVLEEKKKEIRELVDQELKKEFKDYDKWKNFKAWEKKDSGPWPQRILSEEEYKEKRKKARKEKNREESRE